MLALSLFTSSQTYSASHLHCGSSSQSRQFTGPFGYNILQTTPYSSSTSPYRSVNLGFIIITVEDMQRQEGDIIISTLEHSPAYSLLTACTEMSHAHKQLPGNQYILNFNLVFRSSGQEYFYCVDAESWPRCRHRMKFNKENMWDYPQHIFLKRRGATEWVTLKTITEERFKIGENEDYFQTYLPDAKWTLTSSLWKWLISRQRGGRSVCQK